MIRQPARFLEGYIDNLIGEDAKQRQRKRKYMSYPNQFAEFKTTEIETCEGCHEDITEGITAYANGDAEILCQDCFSRREAMADAAYESYKESGDPNAIII